MSESVEAARTRRALTSLLAIVLLACAASSTIERRGGGPYAPVNERNGGSLRYYEGTKSREDAYREMYTFCGGGYEIVDERDINRGASTNYNPNSYNTTVTTMIEHVIDFRCVQSGPPAAGGVRLTGEEWRLAQDEVRRQTGCQSVAVAYEVASPTPGAKGYALNACGRRWLCSAGNGMAACSVDQSQGASAPAPVPAPMPQPPADGPPPPPPVDVSAPGL